jgi:uncharacterized protein
MNLPSELQHLEPSVQTYLDQLSRGHFLIQQCTACNTHLFYPRRFCIHCTQDTLVWTQPKGTGHVYSTTTVRRKPDAGGDYDVSLIELDEGVRLMSTVIGLPPEEVKIGMRVRLKILPNESGPHKVVFLPDPSSPEGAHHA